MKKILNKIKENKEVAIIIAICILGTMIRINISMFDRGVRIYGDELRYFGIAKNLANGMKIGFRNASTSFQKIGYSLVIMVIFLCNNENRTIILGILNSIIICSSIIPVLFICKELKMSKKYIIAMTIILFLCPYMNFSMTFMSEVLYMPLLYWFIFLWLANREKKNYFFSIANGIVCYLGYICKEIFLAVFLAYICTELIFPCVKKIKKLFIDKEKYVFDKENGIKTSIFILTFVCCHVIIKFLFFRGYGNSYNQMGISAILSKYKFTYLIYGFLYQLSAFFLASYILPIPYIISNYKNLEKKDKKLFEMIISFLIISIVTIAYTITVREDLGKRIPRVHLRYITPGILILFIVLFKLFENDKIQFDWKNKFVFKILLIIELFFQIFIFKGIIMGSDADQFILSWYLALKERLEFLGIEKYNIIINILIVLIVILFNYLYYKNLKEIMKNLFIIIVCILFLIGTIYSYFNLIREYKTIPEIKNEVVKINEYIVNAKNKKFLYITIDELGTLVKYTDTYIDYTNNLFIVNKEEILENFNDENKLISNAKLYEPIYKESYESIEEFDYIIIEDGVFDNVFYIQNLEKINEISGTYYTVFKNLEPKTIEVY